MYEYPSDEYEETYQTVLKSILSRVTEAQYDPALAPYSSLIPTINSNLLAIQAEGLLADPEDTYVRIQTYEFGNPSPLSDTEQALWKSFLRVIASSKNSDGVSVTYVAINHDTAFMGEVLYDSKLELQNDLIQRWNRPVSFCRGHPDFVAKDDLYTIEDAAQLVDGMLTTLRLRLFNQRLVTPEYLARHLGDRP